jgi:16S rRNA (guanine527-N7)-methyltransferase
VSERRDDRLLATLERARQRGFLGPGPLDAHLRHARGFAVEIRGLNPNPERVLDLGTGGGVPGFVLADEFPRAGVVFLEASIRRAEFLAGEAAELGWADRIQVVPRRGEDAARETELREQFPVVTARSFAEPAVTAEIAAGFVQVGGSLLVSEPPEPGEDRWPAVGLAALGFGGVRYGGQQGAHFAVISKVAPVPDAYPRATGRPAKRPLW